MKNIFKKLFCLHKWEEMYKCKHIYDTKESFYKMTIVCKHCGKIKQIIL